MGVYNFLLLSCGSCYLAFTLPASAPLTSSNFGGFGSYGNPMLRFPDIPLITIRFGISLVSIAFSTADSMKTIEIRKRYASIIPCPAAFILFDMLRHIPERYNMKGKVYSPASAQCLVRQVSG